MTSHRRIFLTGAVAAALLVGMPTLAAASSLLGGYGGPGQGSQAILGSTLLGGSSGGGGGGSTGDRSAGFSNSFRYGKLPGGTESSVTSSASAGGSSGRKGAVSGTSGSQAGSGGASAGGANTYPTSSATVASETLGLSGNDLPYILLAFAGLVLTGVLTRQLARTGGLEDDNR